MISLSLRLMVRGGREALLRLVVVSVAVTLGVGMLLVTLSAINAVSAQNSRYAWLNASYSPKSAHPVAGVAPLWWQLRGDYFAGDQIGRAEVAATGATSPVPPGIPRLPGPGEYFASPRLSQLMATHPAAELRARYPGHQIGIIGDDALPAPNSLIVIIGYATAEMAALPDVNQVTSFRYAQPGGCGCYSIGINPNGFDLVLGVTAGAILFPVLIFIGAASRLSAARREERFAALRLIGATPRQVAMIAAVESTVAAIIGMVGGFGLFLLSRPAIAQVPFTGDRFFTHDLSLGVVDVLVVALGVPVAAAVASLLALRRVQVSPLGVSRRATPPPPRPYRLILLLAGILELKLVGRPRTGGGQTLVYLAGMLLMMAGLVVAGPWLTLVASQVMARRTRRASVLIASRRLSDNPQAAFRAISGLVLALFVTTVAVGAITTWDANRAAPTGGPGAHSTLVTDFSAYGGTGVGDSVPSVPGQLIDQLLRIDGVDAVTLVHTDPAQTPIRFQGQVNTGGGLVACDQLARTPALGRCGAGAQVAAILVAFNGVNEQSTWPTASISAQQLAALPVTAIAVATDGSRPAVEEARTTLGAAFTTVFAPETVAESAVSPLNTQYEQLADVVILVSLPIAGCSLAASVAAGLNDRRRPFSLLRLTGAPLGVLRRVVVLESAVPLLLSAAVAIGAGFLAASLFVRSQLHYTLRPPGLDYYLIVALGISGSLAVLASTLPILTRISGPENARND
jgi:hypothetical protein